LSIFRYVVELPAKINRYRTTFETLAKIERGCKERQLCMGDCRFIRVLYAAITSLHVVY